MPNLDLEYAHQDVESCVNQWGADIVFQLNETEDHVKRDNTGEAISVNQNSPDQVTIKCWPINVNPTEKDKDNLGITVKTDILVSIPKRIWENLGYQNEDNLDHVRGKFFHRDKRYDISTVQPDSPFLNDFLYYTVGGVKL